MGAMTRTDETFLRGLVERHPALEPLLTEHLDDMEGELLPHLLMADIQRWVAAPGTDRAAALAVVEDLDAALAGADDAVENLIAVSFLEYWPLPPDPASEWRDLFPERLSRLLAELEGR